MTDFTWPSDIVPFDVSFYLEPHTGGTESPFSRKSKLYGLSKPRWVCSMRLRAPDSNDRWGGTKGAWGERIDAFLADLEGRLNRVQLFDFRRRGRAPTFTNAPATAGTNTMTLTGAAPAKIRVGEYIGGDGRPHTITTLTVSGSDLLATVKPYFESDIAGGAATFQNVTGFFRLTSDDAGQNSSPVGALTEYQLDFVEDDFPTVDVTYSGSIVTYTP
jgi:hypothetical protein